jgi:hypothetical protein
MSVNAFLRFRGKKRHESRENGTLLDNHVERFPRDAMSPLRKQGEISWQDEGGLQRGSSEEMR